MGKLGALTREESAREERGRTSFTCYLAHAKRLKRSLKGPRRFDNALLDNENNNHNNKILTMCNEQSYLKQHNPVAVRISMKTGIKRFKTKNSKTFIAKSFNTHI